MLEGDVRTDSWLKNLPKCKKAIILMEGISMYLTLDEIKNLVSNLRSRFEQFSLLMDCYSVFAAKMSKYKNPINDVGVTTVYGIDNPKILESENLAFVKEHNILPEKYIEELKGFEKVIFKKLYASAYAKKLYKLYEFASC
jgi:O-methyltransferase involved in polyketide biosynthesis